MAIRIIVADDHTLIRETLSDFLQEQDGLEVVGRAADGEAVMALTSQFQPDVIIMDVSMPPVLSGLEATRWISTTWPHVKVIALSMYSHRRYVAEMLKAGARGYLLKDAEFDELLAAIHAVVEGKTFVGAGVDTGEPATYPQ